MKARILKKRHQPVYAKFIGSGKSRGMVIKLDLANSSNGTVVEKESDNVFDVGFHSQWSIKSAPHLWEYLTDYQEKKT